MAVLYGRRRCGKSRLLREILPQGRSVYYVGDDRTGTLQIAGLSSEIARLVPGFDQVLYPDFDSLLMRWWSEAPDGAVLTLDEFPALVSASPELPSLLQKQLDRNARKGPHLVITGSSQRMMRGFVLDKSAPLYGRAQEILRISPLAPGWIQDALKIKAPSDAVEAFSVWGGVPRYWELAATCRDLAEAIQKLVLSPLGVLHEEPGTLLLDDLRDTTHAASILSLIGQGCHRLSEIAARMGRPATSLSRPMQRLIDLEFVRRDFPFGSTPRNSRRTLYQISDPFLRFWFRFVEPNRSRLESGLEARVVKDVRSRMGGHVSGVWEDLARVSVPHLNAFDRSWGPARRWWGPGIDRRPMEIDIVAESEDGKSVLIGEAKWSRKVPRVVLEELRARALNFPLAGNREIVLGLWVSEKTFNIPDVLEVTPGDVLKVLR